MRLRPLIVLALLLTAWCVKGEDTLSSDTALTDVKAKSDKPELLFQKANEYYEQKAFQKAIKYYESVVDKGYEAPILYYNLGNAYYKTKQIAPAILNYERAKQLAPGNEDIKHNLRIANLQTADEVEETPEIFLVEWWRQNIASISPNQWARTGIAFMWLAFGSGVLFLFSNGVWRKIGFFGGIVMVALSLLLTLASFLKYQQMQEESHGIVFAQNTYVKSSPDAESTDVFIVHEGLKVELLDEQGKWQQIRLEDGKVGWLKKDAVKVI